MAEKQSTVLLPIVQGLGGAAVMYHTHALTLQAG